MIGIFASTLAALLAAAGTPDGGVSRGDAGPVSAIDARSSKERASRESLRRTSDPSAVEIRHLHVVVERKGERLEVTEVVTLGSATGSVFRSGSGYRIKLPAGAAGPRLAGDRDRSLATEVDEDGFRVIEPIVPGGADLTVQFDIPLEDGSAAFEQRFGGRISVAQVILTWTVGETAMVAKGMGKAKSTVLENGLTALVAMGRNPGSTLSLRITGVGGDEGTVLRWVVLVLSAAMMAFGLIAWLAGRKKAVAGGGSR